METHKDSYHWDEIVSHANTRSIKSTRYHTNRGRRRTRRRSYVSPAPSYDSTWSNAYIPISKY